MPDLWVLCAPQPAGRQAKNLRDARTALQQDAQDDRLTRWGRGRSCTAPRPEFANRVGSASRATGGSIGCRLTWKNPTGLVGLSVRDTERIPA